MGGIEQGMFLPNISGLLGMRIKNKFEFAFGPNVSLSGVALAMAAGTSFHSGDVWFPVNLTLVTSVARKNDLEEIEKTGVRVGLTVGFNSQKRKK